MGAKIQRKHMAHYLNTNFGLNNTDEYVLLGIGLEESSIEMGANVNKTADIVGNTDTFIDTYEKSQSIEPYYARKEDSLTTALQTVIDNDLVLDDLNTDVIDVKTWEEEETDGFPAVKEECVIEVVSYGGDTAGYAIPFNIHRTGVKTQGHFDPETKTFTATV